MKVELTQGQIDGLIGVERVVVNATVYDVGFNDVDFRVNIGKKPIWQYKLWTGVLGRSFSDKVKAKHPTYQDVTCCDEWLSFASFLEWLNKEVGYSGKPSGFELDKDLIIKGNRVYSPEFCCFVPTAVNKLLNDHGAGRGESPVGVCFVKGRGKFKACLNCFGRQKHLGYYTTIEAASFAYKTAKEAQIKIVATQYKDLLSPAVYESLMNWKIEP